MNMTGPTVWHQLMSFAALALVEMMEQCGWLRLQWRRSISERWKLCRGQPGLIHSGKLQCVVRKNIYLGSFVALFKCPAGQMQNVLECKTDGECEIVVAVSEIL